MCEGSHSRALTGQPCKRSAEQQSSLIDLDEILCYTQRYVEDDFAGADRPDAGLLELVLDGVFEWFRAQARPLAETDPRTSKVILTCSVAHCGSTHWLGAL
jgi:hypothetical protein